MLKRLNDYIEYNPEIKTKYNFFSTLNSLGTETPRTTRQKRCVYELIITSSVTFRKLIKRNLSEYRINTGIYMTKKEAKHFFRKRLDKIFGDNDIEKYEMLITLLEYDRDYLKLEKRKIILNQIKSE